MGAAIAVVAPMLMGGGGLMGGLMGGMGGGGILSQILAGILGGAGGAGGAEGIGKAMQGFAPANVLNATANLVSSMLGNSTKDAARTLHREDGMPKFVMDAINKAVDEAVKKHFKPVDPETQNALNDVTKDDSMKEIKKLTDAIPKRRKPNVGRFCVLPKQVLCLFNYDSFNIGVVRQFHHIRTGLEHRTANHVNMCSTNGCPRSHEHRNDFGNSSLGICVVVWLCLTIINDYMFWWATHRFRQLIQL